MSLKPIVKNNNPVDLQPIINELSALRNAKQVNYYQKQARKPYIQPIQIRSYAKNSSPVSHTITINDADFGFFKSYEKKALIAPKSTHKAGDLLIMRVFKSKQTIEGHITHVEHVGDQSILSLSIYAVCRG